MLNCPLGSSSLKRRMWPLIQTTRPGSRFVLEVLSCRTWSECSRIQPQSSFKVPLFPRLLLAHPHLKTRPVQRLSTRKRQSKDPLSFPGPSMNSLTCRIVVTGHKPRPRRYATSTLHGGQYYIFGSPLSDQVGGQTAQGPVNDLYKLIRGNEEEEKPWEWEVLPTPPTEARFGHSATLVGSKW